MKTQPPRNILLAISLAASLVAAPLFAQAPIPPNASASKEEAVMLSPFQVDATLDKGYAASQTLNGTRMKTDLKDIGSALTVFTEQMMNDLGANSIYDLMAFAPNTDPFIMTTSDITGNGNDFINIPTKFVTRGGASTVVSQDFFANGIPNDRFNSEALSFSRGPNAILFGLGNAAGAFVSSTKRAKNTTASTIEYQMDNRGSFRGTLDHNQVLKKNLLSLRYTGLYETQHNFRIPTQNFQRRHFATLNFTPFKKTTIRVNYEKGLINAPAVRPWPDYDGVTPWIAAGKPLIPTFVNTATGKPVGTQNFVFSGLVSTALSPAGTQIPTQNLNNQGQSALPSFANGYAVNGANFRSLVDNSIYPTFATNFGNTAFRLTDYNARSVFWEQEITRDFFIEAAYNKVDSDLVALNGFVGQSTQIFADPNAKLPNGQPNPNVGMLYSQAQSTRIDAPNTVENFRLMASYTLDLTRRSSRWLRYLGRHQAAVFMEHSDSQGWSSNNNLYNATPLATTGAAATLTNGANLLQYRYYFDPAQGKIGTSAGKAFLNYPVLYANTPLPTRDPSGVTPGFIAQQGPSVSESIVTTRALAVQSFFWNNRIVVTNGLRHDLQTGWTAAPADFASQRDANGIAPRPEGVDLRSFKPSSRLSRGGHTYSRGVVFHTLPWMSLSYNTSNNFQVNAAGKDIYGDLLANPEGEGKDYGLKFAFFDRRLFVDVTYYTNSSVNASDSISSNPAGNFKQIDNVWQAIGTFTGDVKYLTYPYSSLSTTWADVVSTTSKGWELAVTANATPRWRVSLNGSLRGDNTTSTRGTIVAKYFAQYLPIIKSRPEWLSLGATGATVAARVADIENTLVNFAAIKNSPASNFAAKWTLNLIQSYDFARETRIAGLPLGGFSLGGSMNARGKAINGFVVDSNLVLDPTQPYTSPSHATFGAWITYKRKLFKNRIDWRLQLNVRNVLDQYTVYPLIDVDTRDGNHTPTTAIYTLKEPRTYLFTSAFRF
jgi:hypothetical protein